MPKLPPQSRLTLGRRGMLVAPFGMLVAPFGMAVAGDARAEWLRDGIVIYAEGPLDAPLKSLGSAYARSNPGMPAVFAAPPAQLVGLLAHQTQGDILIVQPGFMAQAVAQGSVATPMPPLWRNRLVVAGRSRASPPAAFGAATLAAALQGGGVLAVPDASDASAVDGPALIRKLGLSVRVQGTASTADGLDMVHAGTAALAVCHTTELAGRREFSCVMTLPDDAYPPIRYQAALTRRAWSRYQAALLHFLATDGIPLAREQGLEVLI